MAKRKLLAPAYCDPCPCGKIKGICLYYTGTETPNLGIKPDTNFNEVIKIIDEAQQSLSSENITTVARAAITLTTNGSGGPATYNYVTGVLNIPVYNAEGTVTNVSANALSPLFTSSVSTPTTTPVINFTLSNAAANTYFGNNTGIAAAPSYIQAGALIKTDDTNVTLTLGGNPTTALLRSVTMILGWTGQLSLARGGTGAALSDPGGDRIMFWDDSANTVTWLEAGSGITITGTTISSSVTAYTDEQARDTIASFIQDGTGISWVHNDGSDTLTPTITLAPFSTTNLTEGSNLYFTNERVDDRVAALLVEGANITLTYDDIANTITIEGAAGGGGGTDPVVVTSSATSLSLTTTGSYIKTYVFTGSSDTTWTLPAIGTTAQIIKVKNRGTANIILQRAGSDEIYTSAPTTSFTILTGDAFELQDDGTYWILNG